MTATLKSKQTSIATVRYHLLPVAFLLTPLIFHYPLPLRTVKQKVNNGHHFCTASDAEPCAIRRVRKDL